MSLVDVFNEPLSSLLPLPQLPLGSKHFVFYRNKCAFCQRVFLTDNIEYSTVCLKKKKKKKTAPLNTQALAPRSVKGIVVSTKNSFDDTAWISFTIGIGIVMLSDFVQLLSSSARVLAACLTLCHWPRLFSCPAFFSVD